MSGIEISFNKLHYFPLSGVFSSEPGNSVGKNVENLVKYLNSQTKTNSKNPLYIMAKEKGLFAKIEPVNKKELNNNLEEYRIFMDAKNNIFEYEKII